MSEHKVYHVLVAKNDRTSEKKVDRLSKPRSETGRGQRCPSISQAAPPGSGEDSYPPRSDQVKNGLLAEVVSFGSFFYWN